MNRRVVRHVAQTAVALVIVVTAVIAWRGDPSTDDPTVVVYPPDPPASVLAAPAAVTPAPDGPAPTVAVTPTPADPWETVVITAEPDTGLVHPADDEFRYIELYDGPDGEAVSFDQVVLNPTWFGSPLTLMVTEGSVGDEWVEVQLPVRPNGSTAWVRTDGFAFDSHRFHATVDLSSFHLSVFDGDELVAETAAVIGRDDTPTPVGRWYVNDKVPGDGAAYGSWILSLSAFSETLDTFDGGLPVIAIHGTNAPELVGQAVSNGCVRIPDEVVALLADTVPIGTPVEVVA